MRLHDKIASHCTNHREIYGGKISLQNSNGFIGPINIINAVSAMASLEYYEARLEGINFVY